MIRIWRKRKPSFNQLLRRHVRALERSGVRLPADRNEALSAMSATIANLVKVVGDFEGRPYGEVPSREEWAQLGRTAVRLVDRRRRR